MATTWNKFWIDVLTSVNKIDILQLSLMKYFIKALSNESSKVFLESCFVKIVLNLVAAKLSLLKQLLKEVLISNFTLYSSYHFFGSR